MITIAFPGLKEYCQISYNVQRRWWESLDFYTQAGANCGLQPPFDESGEVMKCIEQYAREKVFPEYLEQIRANGHEVVLFDV